MCTLEQKETPAHILIGTISNIASCNLLEMEQDFKILKNWNIQRQVEKVMNYICEVYQPRDTSIFRSKQSLYLQLCLFSKKLQ
jgi:hypothetical protein